MTPIVSLVAAVAENGVIGQDGGMPWRLPSDLKRFKALTMGRPMIMGRKTFAAIGKALPGRTSIVVTRDPAWTAEGVSAAGDIETALRLAGAIAARDDVAEVAIVGGAEIYALAMPYAGRLHQTLVHAAPQGDTFFPPLDGAWRETARVFQPAGERDSADMSFVTLERDGSPRLTFPPSR